ncbi:DMT family transporter [Mobilicoccus pelagius]|uniref:EamA domain-containing protein n=1 Tax=Mobilicoccus pelagius NBRC 104925 TaxID=1089455 RepID=H5UQL5_9MICO|nr:DMT family transporter [Mobilicoccus pelagius]GAB48023.1 hypothetical protein MOPEL_032_00660 [Mobilicoccus pelagius NBRC 104925]
MGSLLLALCSALAFGTSDFLGGVAARREQVLRILVVSYPVSGLLMMLVALVAGGHATPAALAWGAAAGVALALAAWTFFVSLATGPISIVSPVTALLGSVVPFTIGIALGEEPGILGLLGVGLALAATVLVSLSPDADTAADRPFTPQVATLTVVAGFSFAMSFVFTGRIPAGTGLTPLVAARWAATLVVLLVALSRRACAPPTPGPVLGYAVGVGVLDTVAHTTMLLALQQTLLSIGSVVISLFPAVTVALAVVLLGERVSRAQIVGLSLAAAGLAFISG